MKDIIKHGREFLRALRNGHYEQNDAGQLMLTKQKVTIGGVFDHWVNGTDHARDANLVVNEGLDNILNLFANQVAENGGGYFIAPFSGNVPVAAARTHIDFTAAQTEFTTYTSATRVAWTPNGVSSGQSVSNSVAPAQFTLNAGGTIWGVGLLTASAKSATTGLLMAGTQFGAARSGLLSGDILSVAYTLAATSS